MERVEARAPQLLRNMKWVLGLFIAGHFSHHLVTALRDPLMPLLREDFGLTYARAGLLVMSFSMAYGIGQIPMGWIADRVGRKLLISLGLGGVALAAVGVGLSATFYMVAVFLAVMGLLGGTYHPAASPLISDTVPAKARGSALGIHATGGSLSFFLAPIFALLIAGAIGWRGSYLILAIPTVVAGALYWVLVKERKTAVAPLRQAQGEAPRQTQDSPVRQAQDPTALSEDTRTQWRGVLRILVPLVGIAVLSQAATMGVNAFIPLYLVDKHGVEEVRAGMMLSAIYAAGLVAAPAGGFVSDRLGRKPVILFAALATGPLLYLITITPFGAGMIALFVFLGVTIYVRMPVVESFIVDVVPATRRSLVMGVYFFSSLESSSVLTPGIGYLSDRLGPDRAFALVGAIVFGASLLATAGFIYAARRLGRKVR